MIDDLAPDPQYETWKGGYDEGFRHGVKAMLDDKVALAARIAAALAILRTAPDLDTAEPSKAVLRRAHTALTGAWAELADEPPSQHGPIGEAA